MKTYKSTVSRLLILFIPLLILSGCSLFEDDEPKDPEIPDNWLENSYKGTLTVNFTNVYPKWDVSTTMDTDIDKETGLITFSGATLNYSGETLVSADSKIIRSGNWSIDPTGIMMADDSVGWIEVDAHVVINTDVQKIYAKTNDGNWKLMNETDFASTPNSDLVFSIDDAVISGSVVSASSDLGSITWTLRLTPALD